MSDEQVSQAEPTGEEEPQPEEDVGLEDLPQSWQEHIKDLRSENAGRRTKLQEIEEEQERAREEEMQRKEEWKELAEKRQGELDALAQEKETLERKLLVQDVAQEIGLPPNLADRLQGDTREELVKDAKELHSLVSQQAEPIPETPPDEEGAEDVEDEEKRRRAFHISF